MEIILRTRLDIVGVVEVVVDMDEVAAVVDLLDFLQVLLLKIMQF